MRRLVLLLGGVYVGAALFAHWRERSGQITCECRPDCWCKKPGVSLFRWVFPVGHSLRG